MINKSIQPVDLANLQQSTPQTTVGSGTEGGGAIFSGLFSSNLPDLPGKESGNTLPVPGNILPGQDLQAEGRSQVQAETEAETETRLETQVQILAQAGVRGQARTGIQAGTQTQTQTQTVEPAQSRIQILAQAETRVQAVGDTATAVDQPDDPVITDVEFITGKPAQPVESLLTQLVRAQEIPETSRVTVADNPVIAGYALAPDQPGAGQSEGQVVSSAEQIAGQVMRTPIQVPGWVIDSQGLSTRDLNDFEAQSPGRGSEQTITSAVRMESSRPQSLTLPVGSAADVRTVAQAVFAESPVTGTDLLNKGAVIEAGKLNGNAIVKEFLPGDDSRISNSQAAVSNPVREVVQSAIASQAAVSNPVREVVQSAIASQVVVSNPVREVVQSAIASQAGNSDLKQFLQGRQDSQLAANVLAAQTGTGTNSLAFLNTLSESSPLAPPSARVQVPVGQQGWGDAVGQQVTWFVSQNVSAANLRLNPRHLGPMELQISMDGDKTNVSFLSQNTIVRDALESSLPRLREMLADSGLNLVNVNISQHSASDQKDRGATGFQQGMNFSREDSDSSEAGIKENMPQATAAASGLIDAYA